MLKWQLALSPNSVCRDMDVRTRADIENAGFYTCPAEVPGNFELDLMREGKLDDLFFGENTLKAQKLENLHLWYFTEFTAEKDEYLHFEGIDTISDIYVNGKLSLSTDNMFVAYDVSDGVREGVNEVVVHIKPCVIESRKHSLPVISSTLKYSYSSLYIRKAPHMFGWDIMPRIVSGGLWKPVTLKKKKPDRILDAYILTHSINEKYGFANMYFHINTELDGDFADEYTVKVSGRCDDASFSFEKKLWHTTLTDYFCINDVKLWNPKNYGEPNLYETVIRLYRGNELCDEYRLNVGVRTVRLDMTDTDDRDGNGEFCFVVNNKRIFVLGTNWVPLDAFHSRDKDRLPKALEMLCDIGCNAVRCWGGNVYESDEFYDFCDKNGIIVWQDFSMACAVYPQEREFAEMLEKEAVYIVKRLRNHPSIVLWAGDNECDMSYMYNGGYRRNPNNNFLTRQVLKQVVQNHDYVRPYLPSSPFVSEKAYAESAQLPENHLWGPRDYFKGDYYKNTICHFASETGYHGFPSVSSLKKFLAHPEIIHGDDGKPTTEYLVHSASPEEGVGGDIPFSYRIDLACDQVKTLFGKASDDLETFVKQSQISQAEAKKYFIERFRLSKWRRTGIIWWNLLDGWPQVSDAIVDYYFTKKLAYSYIKRSQQPVCLMFDEPQNGVCRLFGVNDTEIDTTAEFTVTDVLDGVTVLSGKAVLSGHSSSPVAQMPVSDEKKFFLIEWKCNGVTSRNHYFTNIIDINCEKYISALEKCGFDCFEN